MFTVITIREKGKRIVVSYLTRMIAQCTQWRSRFDEENEGNLIVTKRMLCFVERMEENELLVRFAPGKESIVGRIDAIDADCDAVPSCGACGHRGGIRTDS